MYIFNKSPVGVTKFDLALKDGPARFFVFACEGLESQLYLRMKLRKVRISKNQEKKMSLMSLIVMKRPFALPLSAVLFCQTKLIFRFAFFGFVLGKVSCLLSVVLVWFKS